MGRFREATRWLLPCALLGVITLLALSTTYFYLEVGASHVITIKSTQWDPIWRSNGTPASMPSQYYGTCQDLSGTYAPASLVHCVFLLFQSALTGSNNWTYVSDISLGSPFNLSVPWSESEFGNSPGLTILVLDIHMPSTPGSYDFQGTLWVIR